MNADDCERFHDMLFTWEDLDWARKHAEECQKCAAYWDAQQQVPVTIPCKRIDQPAT